MKGGPTLEAPPQLEKLSMRGGLTLASLMRMNPSKFASDSKANFKINN